MDLDDLLQKTSRTFALAIPLLPEPTRTEVGLAYLLFRVADTFEDAVKWSPAQRIDALERFVELFETPQLQERHARALVELSRTSPPLEHAGYLELLAELPALLTATRALRPRAREILERHTVRTAEGMAQVVARADARGNLRLTTKQDLKDYCYLVAGIVGELLTELFVLETPSLERERSELRATMLGFGEGLQLVNIVKDATSDATEGRVFLPAGLSLHDAFAMARADLEQGDRYVGALQRGGAPRGYLAFTGLSLVLAWKALEVLERAGSGAKVSRDDVGALFGKLNDALDAGAPLNCRNLSLSPRGGGEG